MLSTFIKLLFSIKTFVLFVFEWPLKTGFTVGAWKSEIKHSPNCLILSSILVHPPPINNKVY